MRDVANAGTPITSAAGLAGLAVSRRGSGSARPRVAAVLRGTGGPPWRRYALVATCLVIVVLCVVLLVVSTSRDTVSPAARPALVVASLPFWNLARGTETVLTHQRTFTEVSPWLYGLDENGNIVSQVPTDRADEVARHLRTLQSSGLTVTPSIANMTNGRWAYEPVARILHDPQRMRRHVAEIVELVLRNDYAGIDIDYENLRASDRDEFTRFLAELGRALHAHDKVLSVALFAKASDAGYDERNKAQDYAAIGRVVDQVRLMGYDRHWETSEPGPVAPIGWIRDVLRYATSRIAPHKIVLGVPLYGYDWSNGRGRPVSWREAIGTAERYHALVRFDAESQSPWFTYTDARGVRHEVWFENAASSAAKFRAAREAGIGGIYLWMYGPADTETWSQLRQVLPAGA